MSASALRRQLEELLQLILRERELAKSLDIEALGALQTEKEALLGALGEAVQGESAPELKELAARVREENRRNAYLFWSALGFIRSTMEFLGLQATPPGYGARGSSPRPSGGGLILSGRV